MANYFLLQEDGSFLLQQNNDKIIISSSVDPTPTPTLTSTPTPTLTTTPTVSTACYLYTVTADNGTSNKDSYPFDYIRCNGTSATGTVINLESRIVCAQLDSVTSTSGFVDPGEPGAPCSSNPTATPTPTPTLTPTTTPTVTPTRTSTPAPTTTPTPTRFIPISSSTVPYNLGLTSETTIYVNEVKCRVLENDFNYSQNPTVFKYISVITGSAALPFYSSSVGIITDGTIADNLTGSAFRPYVTTVGLYNESNDLLVVGKLATPYPIPSNTDITFIVRWDS